jgi:phage terminase large subunit-like protein
VATTTPRPIALIRDLLKESTTAATRGSTYENKENLAPAFLDKIVKKYEGTRLGRQELNAEILDDNPGALWQRDHIESLRIRKADLPDLVRIFEGVDPAVSSGEESAETGIIIVGESLPMNGVPHYYVLADYSLQGTPHQWATAVSNGYYDFMVDRAIGEQNNGGELVEVNVRTVDPNISYRGVYASRGKRVRAEPISALYEQGRVHHVGTFPELEDQLCEWVPGEKSPDRLDALVWAISALIEVEERQETTTMLDDDNDYSGISPV